jgi:hypothetical protein
VTRPEPSIGAENVGKRCATWQEPIRRIGYRSLVIERRGAPKAIDLITSREFISIVAPQPDHLKDMWYK